MGEELPEDFTTAKWFRDVEIHSCGYCGLTKSHSNGMFADNLEVRIYEDLINRGWRRSGIYLYKPLMKITCCKQYAIRCDAANFKLNKSHKKIIKKVNKFATDGILKPDIQLHTTQFDEFYMPNETNDDEKIDDSNKSADCSSTNTNGNNNNDNNKLNQMTNKVEKGNNSFEIESKKIKKYKAGIGPDPNKPLSKKAKILRLEYKKEQNGQSIQSISKPKTNTEKTLTQFLEEMPSDSKLKFKLVSCHSESEWKKYLTVEFEIYEKYQKSIHDDSSTLSGFTRFLVKTPLKPEPFPDGIDGPGYGTFHHQFWYEDKLIAVGVIDILPSCISSVYFFYDPDYAALALGTYGSLMEVNLVKKYHVNIPALKYYYMGYYIHTCPKMRYKGHLKPSFLLCPETYTWIAIERCLSKLDINAYSRLNDDPNVIDENLCSLDDVKEMHLIWGRYILKIRELEIKQLNVDLLTTICNLVGKKVCKNIAFCIIA